MEIKLKQDEHLDYLLKDQVPIIQTNDSFSFSLDTILLANLARPLVHDNYRIADLCAGNGAASLYLAQFNQAQYDLVELQEPMADIAERSIALNELESRLHMHQGDVNEVTTFLKKDNYDLVICNPPYFKVPAGHRINPAEKKAIARHEIMVNLEQVVAAASQLLKTRGKFYLVHRPERLAEIVLALHKYDLHLKIVQPYVPKPGKDANLIVIQAIKSSSDDGVVLKPDIVVHQSNTEYTKEISDIFNV